MKRLCVLFLRLIENDSLFTFLYRGWNGEMCAHMIYLFLNADILKCIWFDVGITV